MSLQICLSKWRSVPRRLRWLSLSLSTIWLETKYLTGYDNSHSTRIESLPQTNRWNKWHPRWQWKAKTVSSVLVRACACVWIDFRLVLVLGRACVWHIPWTNACKIIWIWHSIRSLNLLQIHTRTYTLSCSQSLFHSLSHSTKLHGHTTTTKTKYVIYIQWYNINNYDIYIYIWYGTDIFGELHMHTHTNTHTQNTHTDKHNN